MCAWSQLPFPQPRRGSRGVPAPPDPGEGGEWDAHGSTGFGPGMAETWHCLLNPAVSYTFKSKQGPMWKEQNKIFPACVRKDPDPPGRCRKDRMKSWLPIPLQTQLLTAPLEAGFSMPRNGERIVSSSHSPVCGSWLPPALCAGICQGGWAVCKPQMHQGCGVSVQGAKINGEKAFSHGCDGLRQL